MKWFDRATVGVFSALIFGFIVFVVQEELGRKKTVATAAPATQPLIGGYIGPLTAFGRLEDVTQRAGMEITVFTLKTYTGEYECTARAESLGNDRISVRRTAPTCEAAATEVLRALEVRNVK